MNGVPCTTCAGASMWVPECMTVVIRWVSTTDLDMPCRASIFRSSKYGQQGCPRPQGCDRSYICRPMLFCRLDSANLHKSGSRQSIMHLLCMYYIVIQDTRRLV